MTQLMTRFGKFLVLANLVLGIAFATLAAAIVHNRIDWLGTDEPDQAEARKVKPLAKKIDLLQADFKRKFMNWRTERAKFDRLVQTRQQNQKWYAEQIAIIEEGKDGTGKVVDPAVRSLVYDKGILRVNKDGLPDLGPQPPDPRYKSQREMRETLAKLEEDIKKEIQAISALIMEQEKLTFELNGEKDKKKGLTQLLATAELAKKLSSQEVEKMRDERIDRDQEANLLLRRREQLSARLDQLKKWKNIGVAARQP